MSLRSIAQNLLLLAIVGIAFIGCKPRISDASLASASELAMSPLSDADFVDASGAPSAFINLATRQLDVALILGKLHDGSIQSVEEFVKWLPAYVFNYTTLFFQSAGECQKLGQQISASTPRVSFFDMYSGLIMTITSLATAPGPCDQQIEFDQIAPALLAKVTKSPQNTDMAIGQPKFRQPINTFFAGGWAHLFFSVNFVKNSPIESNFADINSVTGTTCAETCHGVPARAIWPIGPGGNAMALDGWPGTINNTQAIFTNAKQQPSPAYLQQLRFQRLVASKKSLSSTGVLSRIDDFFHAFPLFQGKPIFLDSRKFLKDR